MFVQAINAGHSYCPPARLLHTRGYSVTFSHPKIAKAENYKELEEDNPLHLLMNS
jgi:hypothetical protein